jgi:uncharacterized protein YdaU (DUF1376 family)
MSVISAWMPWYGSDYLRDTLHLTLEEDGTYRRALDYLWAHPEGLPIDYSELSRCLRLTTWEVKRCWPRVVLFFTIVNGSYRNQRIDIEFAKATHRSNQARANRTGTPVTTPVVTPVERTSHSPPSPSHKHKERTSKVVFEADSEPYLLAKGFSTEFVPNWAPGFKPLTEQQLQNWAREFDAMMRIDHRTYAGIEELANWIHKQPESKAGFSWRKNILSPKALRQKWNEGKFGASGFIPKSFVAQGLT